MVHVLLAMGPHLFSLFLAVQCSGWRKSEEDLPDSSLQVWGSQESAWPLLSFLRETVGQEVLFRAWTLSP